MARNITILAVLVVVAVAAIMLSMPPPATFHLVIHAYDPALGNPPNNINQTALIGNVALTVTGPKSITTSVPAEGILPLPDALPEGTYLITAAKTGYSSSPITYVVGSNCDGKDQFGVCHAWVPMSKTSP